jgi:hypothetical protein
VFFYAEGGLTRSAYAREVFQPYLLASTRIVLVLFAIPIAFPLALVVLEPAWSRGLFVVLSALLVVANVETTLRVRAFERGYSLDRVRHHRGSRHGYCCAAHFHTLAPRRHRAIT